MAAVEAIKKAIRSGETDDLEEEKLHELGLDVNSTLGNDGYTPLHWACHYGRAEVLQHFMELGADIHQCTEQGWTAAHICAIRGCTVCLNVLCSSGLDLTREDSRGYACIHLAAAHGKCSALQAIIKSGIDIKMVDRRGWNVLHHAAFHGRLNVLQLVIKLGVDANVNDEDGNTPAHLAAMEGHLDCLKLLVYHKDQPLDVVTSTNNDGSIPKDLAVQFQKQDCIDFLASVEDEAEVFEDDDAGDEFPSHSAASEGNAQLLGMLLIEGHCGVDDTDNHGSTAAHKAAGNGHLECLQLLVDHGANVTIKNSSGDTPKDVAKRYAQLGCLALLSTLDQTDNDSEVEEEESCKKGIDHPTPQAVARAGEKVEELQRLLDRAKTHYRQLGGELPEDREIELLKAEHIKGIAEFESKLEYERGRREELEAEVDEARKKLREAINVLDQYQLLNSRSQATFTPEPTPEHHHSHRSRRRTARTKVPVGGAFVRIGHV